MPKGVRSVRPGVSLHRCQRGYKRGYAPVFGLIQGLIGVAEQGVQVIPWMAEIAAYADGDRCAGALAFLLDAGAHAVGDLFEGVFVAGDNSTTNSSPPHRPGWS